MLRLPLDNKLNTIFDIPYTLSYVIRKYQQIENLSELPKEKRPPDSLLWEGTPEEMEEWLDKVLGNSKSSIPNEMTISLDDIE